MRREVSVKERILSVIVFWAKVSVLPKQVINKIAKNCFLHALPIVNPDANYLNPTKMLG